MSNEREGWILSVSEIAAILSLAGRTQFVGLTQSQPEQLRPQALLNGCCTLLRDRMLTQADGRYRLSAGLADVMEPVCTAQMVLVLFPGRGHRGRRLFHVGRSITMMEQSIRGVILRHLEPQELSGILWENMEPCPAQIHSEAGPLPPDASASRELLFRDASSLLEKQDPQTGKRLDWLRLRRQELQDAWLEWTDHGAVRQAPLNRKTFAGAVDQMLKGVSI